MQYSTKQEVLADLEAKISELEAFRRELVGNQAVEVETALELEERVKNKPDQVMISTGLRWLDDKLSGGGIKKGAFINLGGQSFAGKTTFALKLLNAITNDNKALLFSFEMYENRLVEYLAGWDQLNKRRLLVYQSSYKLDTVETVIRDQASKGIMFFVIDSRMKIEVDLNIPTYEKIAYASNRLSKLCRDLGVIILQINQISEADQKDGRLSLKGSGDQYYDSDIVWFISITKKKDSDDERRIFHCEKDRLSGKRWKLDITDPRIEYTTYTMPKIGV